MLHFEQVGSCVVAAKRGRSISILHQRLHRQKQPWLHKIAVMSLRADVIPGAMQAVQSNMCPGPALPAVQLPCSLLQLSNAQLPASTSPLPSHTAREQLRCQLPTSSSSVTAVLRSAAAHIPHSHWHTVHCLHNAHQLTNMRLSSAIRPAPLTQPPAASGATTAQRSASS